MPVHARPLAIGLRSTRIIAPAAQYSAAFDRDKAIVCDEFFDPDLFAMLQARCRAAAFAPHHVDRLGSREVEAPPVAGRLISQALSRPEMLEWVSQLTACGPLARASGLLVRACAGEPHALHWHSDLSVPTRRVAITIDFSDAAYEGGLFELRRGRGPEILATHRHDTPGSALLFAVHDELFHRVLPVTAGGPRRVYAGWFHAGD